MVHRDCRRVLATLLGVILLLLPVGGAVLASPSVVVTISLTTTPQPPTDFTITQIGVGSINITWTKGLGANITIVRGSTTSYPFSVFDGDAIYSGNGTYVEVGSLHLTTYTYYYRAWSQNNYGTSTGYDQASIGADAEGTDVSVLTTLIADLIEGPTGIVNMMFATALMAFTFWKKGWVRILLSLSLIIWGVFEMQYDIKIAAPFIAVGAFLFILGIMRMIALSREASSETV